MVGRARKSSPIGNGMSLITPVGEKMGGIFFYDGQVQLARCFSDAGAVPGVVRDRCPLGPRSTSVGSKTIPKYASGPDAVLFAL